MTQAEVLSRAKEFVESLFLNDFSGHDIYHTLRVTKLARSIAEKEGADAFTVSLAALLHDADDIKLSPDTAKNKLNARSFMTSCGIDGNTQDAVCLMISEVSFGGTGGVTPSTLEGKCVQDADRLDALGAIGIARTFAYGGSHHRPIYDPTDPPREHMTEAEYRSSNSSSINHFYEKLFRLKDLMNTDTAKAAATEREKLMKDYISAFMREWNGEL